MGGLMRLRQQIVIQRGVAWYAVYRTRAVSV